MAYFFLIIYGLFIDLSLINFVFHATLITGVHTAVHHVRPSLEGRDLEERHQARRNMVEVAPLRVRPLRELAKLEPARVGVGEHVGHVGEEDAVGRAAREVVPRQREALLVVGLHAVHPGDDA